MAANTRLSIYVQYGCGLCTPDAWVNFDASPRLRLERVPIVRTALKLSIGLRFPTNVQYGDIVLGLPLEDNAASGVYCSHVLEHLPRNELAKALLQTKRILRPGGRFRLVVPDLRWRASEYIDAARSGDPIAADRFLDRCMLRPRVRGLGIIALIRETYGLSAHWWMYDFAVLRMLLEDAGFMGVRECEMGDSNDPMFALVEDKERFFEGGERELAVEAVKPA